MKRNVFDKGFLGMILVVSLLSTACETITEFPDENGVDPTLVNMSIDVNVKLDFDDSQKIIVTRNGEVDNLLRTVIEVYKFDDATKPVLRDEKLSVYDGSDIDVNFELNLNATRYRLIVWTDYVNSAEGNDLFFNTENTLRKISVSSNNWGANTDYKSCASAYKDIDLTSYKDKWNINVHIDMEPTRPVSKLAFVSKDINKYISRANSRGENLSRADLESFKAVVTYKGFSPSGFDVYDQSLAASVNNVSYSAGLKLLSDSTVLVAYDYVFAGNDSTAYDMSFQFYNNEGKMVNQVDRKFNIVNDRYYIIMSDFLTGEKSSDIVIDGEYDGSIDVVLP